MNETVNKKENIIDKYRYCVRPQSLVHV